MNVFYRHTNFELLQLVGSDVQDFLQRTTTNDFRNVVVSHSVITAACTDKGRIVDILRCYNNENAWNIIVSKSAVQSLVQWFRKYIIADDVSIRLQDDVSILEFWGEDILSFFNQAFSLNCSIEHRMFTIDVNGSETHVFISKHTDDVSVFVAISSSKVAEFESMIEENCKLVSQMDWNLERIRKGIAIAPNELNDKHNVLEAMLVHCVSFKKGCYIGQEVIARLDTYNKVQYRLVGLNLESNVTENSSILFEGKELGTVTSVVESDNGSFIALAYVRGEIAIPNCSVIINDSGIEVPATVCQLPFVN